MKKFIVLIPFLFVFSCVTSQNEGAVELSATEERTAEEMRTEVELGRNMAGRLFAGYGVNQDQKLNDYVSLLGAYLASSGDFSAHRHALGVTENTSVSGYSCPGGYILVSKGALAAAENEAEIAGVIAHEMSHVHRKHVLQIIQKRSATKSQKASDDPEIKMREREQQKDDSKAGSTLARYLSGPGGAMISLAAAARAGLAALVEEGLDHDMEYEADKDALEAIMRAGYDGSSYIGYLSRLEKQASKEGKSSLDKTHPALKTRVDRLNAQYAALRSQFSPTAKGVERFAKMTASLRANKTVAE